MAVLRLVGWVVSLPLLWVGQLACALKLPWGPKFLAAAWRVGGDGQVAYLALSRMRPYEPAEVLRPLAARWFAARPCPQIAAFAGMLAFSANDLDEAQRMLAAGRDAGGQGDETLDMLELFLVVRSNDLHAAAELVARWQTRRDLGVVPAKFVCEQLLLDAMLHGHWAEAEQRAKHLWAIEDAPAAATAFWALDRRRGETSDLAAFLKPGALNPADMLFYETLGFIVAGTKIEIERALAALRAVDEAMADRAQQYLQQKETPA